MQGKGYRRTRRCCCGAPTSLRWSCPACGCGSGATTATALSTGCTAATCCCRCGPGVGVGGSLTCLGCWNGRHWSCRNCGRCGTSLSTCGGSCAASATATAGSRRGATAATTTTSAAPRLCRGGTDLTSQREILSLQLALPVHIDVGAAKVARCPECQRRALHRCSSNRTSFQRTFRNRSRQCFALYLQV